LSEKLTIVTKDDGRGRLTLWLDRPEKRNALDEAALNAIADVARTIRAERNARVLLLRSSSSVFCAGADLNEWAHVTPTEAARLSMVGNEAFAALADLTIPTIAVLEGPALGGGLELALACDIRVGGPAARVGFPEPRLGNAPGWGGIARLMEVAGVACARNMLLTGDPLDALDALRVGILQRLWPDEELQSRLDGLVESVLACDPATLALLKSTLKSDDVKMARDAALAGFDASRPESKARKAAFLGRRRSERGVSAS
jgi:enoyl-CoA hydratase/carnithine racemase